jgi:hypothetical protein
MAKTLLDFVTTDVTEKTELDGSEVIYLGDAQSARATVLTLITAVKALAGGPVSDIPSLSSIVTGMEASDIAGPVNDETGQPSRAPGFLYYNDDGSVSVTGAFLSGIAYQQWVIAQIAEATEGLGNNSLPTNILTMSAASSLFVPINGALHTLPRHLRYEVYHSFPQAGTSGTLSPLSFSGVGTTTGAFVSSTAAEGYPSAPLIRSSVVANSGGRIGSLRDGTILQAGSIVDIRWRVLTTSGTTIIVGFADPTATAAPTVLAGLVVSGTTATPRVLNGTTTDGTPFSVVANTPYETVVEILPSGAMRTTTKNLSTGAILSSATVSATVPTSPVGGMLYAISSGAAVADLAVIHDFGMSPRGIGAA